MKLKDFIKLLEEQDMNKELCLYNTISGNRVPVSMDDIDWSMNDTIDIELREVLE